MPPIRTVSTTKPMKTERTHEENQERAYIAASRRSDRSLEARIESARRASEIHKKRTGRALRVTEQDVVNEEMYEEEDDDLPAQIRRLQSFAHLQTGSMEFNRRLQAYMSSQMATRSALMEQSNYAYPNAPFFANQFAQPQQQPTMLPPQMLHYSNQSMRHAPYPMSPQGFGAGHHQRAASIATTQDFGYMHSTPTSPAVAQFNEEQRRMSLPPQSAPSTPVVPDGQTPMRPPMSRSASKVHMDGATPQPLYSSPTSQAPMSTTAGSSLPASAEALIDPSVQALNFTPFSTSLPQETQQLLAQPSSMDVNNAFTPYWASAGPAHFPYSYKPNSYSQAQPSGLQSAMDSTLGLNPLDTNIENSPVSQSYATSATTDGVSTPFGGGFDNYSFNVNGSFADNMKGSGNMTRTSSGRDSGNVTPNGDWTSFLESYEDTCAGNLSA